MGNIFARFANFSICVHTGEKKGAGTDNDVFIALFDDKGQESEPIELDNPLWDDFESGRKDLFAVKHHDHLGHIKKIKLWRAGVVDDDWYVNTITIERKDTQDKSYFPIHRWIPQNKPLYIEEFDSHLPGESAHPEQRKEELLRKQATYVLDRKDHIGCALVQAKDLPQDEHFADDYRWNLKSTKYKLALRGKFSAIKPGRWEKIKDIFQVYGGAFGIPTGSKDWDSDKVFGNLRLAGPDPKSIELCKEIPSNFAVNAQDVQPLLEDMTLSDAIEKKKIFIIDYKITDKLFKDEEKNKGVCAPLGLFYLNKATELLPIAIQLEQEPADDNPVFYPSDPKYTWLLAKMWFNLAETIHHEGVSHLGFTHLIMESICLAANRQLSISHPMFRLLAPHFLNLLAINYFGLPTLIFPGGWAQSNMACEAEGMLEIIRRASEWWRLDVHGTLPKSLEERGVDDPEILPHYPYRDDALPVYHAIKKYLTTVVESVYDSQSKLDEDHELQNFAAELSKPYEEGGCAIKGVPGNGKFSNTDDLIAALTSIVYICSVEHSAVNFLQYDYYGFPPAYSYWIGTERPKDKEPRTEADIIAALPSKERTIRMMLITKILSSRGTMPLGYFEVDYAFDPVALKALEKFREELQIIEKDTIKRNESRPIDYDILLPKFIPNSISV